jgi:hypothetical protein
MPSSCVSNNRAESMMAAPPLSSWPLSDNRFIDIDSREVFNERYFEEVESITDERTSIIHYSPTDSVLTDNNSAARQSKQFNPASTAQSSLSLNSLNISVSHEPHNPVTVAKNRTRRRSSKTIMTGPNPHGRTGKLRCELCRSQRQGVSSV